MLIGCDAMRCDAMQCNAMQRNALYAGLPSIQPLLGNMYVGWVRRGTLLLKQGDPYARIMFVIQGELVRVLSTAARSCFSSRGARGTLFRCSSPKRFILYGRKVYVTNHLFRKCYGPMAKC